MGSAISGKFLSAARAHKAGREGQGLRKALSLLASFIPTLNVFLSREEIVILERWEEEN